MLKREYHKKIKRLPIGEIPKTRRPLMSLSEMNELLTGDIIIEEKLDGTLGSLEQGKLHLFCEDLQIRHTVFYDRLPSFNILLDIAEGRIILPPEERLKFIRFGSGLTIHLEIPPVIDRRVNMTPTLFRANLFSYLNRVSAFASQSQIEGIVVKNYQKQLFGKVVNIEFYRGIEADVSYLKRRIPETNRLLR